MAKINLDNLSPEELDKLSKEAKTKAKLKRNQEKQALIVKLGKLTHKNIDSILGCQDLKFDIRESFAKLVSKDIKEFKPKVSTASTDA